MVEIQEPPGVRHFSMTNPPGAGQYDVPALLRRVADALETLGPVEIHEVTFRLEPLDDGDERPTMTVQYYPTSSFEEIRDLFAPFIRDAEATAGVRFVVEDAGADAGSVRVVVRDADGTGDGFSFDRQGRGDDQALRALECFDVLQESVHEVLARRGRSGPWPPCPAVGHTHHLVTAWDAETSTSWWSCPEGGRLVLLGDLSEQ